MQFTVLQPNGGGTPQPGAAGPFIHRLPAGFNASMWQQLVIETQDLYGPTAQIQSITEDGTTAIVVLGTPNGRPDPLRFAPAEGRTFKPDDIRVLATSVSQKYPQHSLVEVTPTSAVFARLTPPVATLRARFTRDLGLTATPWDVEIRVLWATDTATDGTKTARLDHVHARINKTLGLDAGRRLTTLQGLLSSIPGANPDWGIMENLDGSVLFSYRKRRQLPTRVNALDILPKTLAEGRFDTVNIGVDADGAVVSMDTIGIPHVAIAGSSGAGKTVQLRTFCVGLLAAGWDLIGIDTGKYLAGMEPLKKHARLWFTEKDNVVEAAVILTAVYREVSRRAQLIAEHGCEKWQNLPPELGIRPIALLIDEAAALLRTPTNPGPVPDGHPLKEEYKKKVVARATAMNMLEKIAAEARSAGVKLILSTQIFRSDLVDTNIRNLLNGVLMMINPVKPPDRIEMQFLMGTFAADAIDEAARLSDGRSPGLGITYSDEGGGVRGYRSGYLDKDDVGPYLASLGLPEPEPFEILPEDRATFDAMDNPDGYTTPFRRPERPQTPLNIPEERVVGELTFDLDQLTTVDSTDTDSNDDDDDVNPFALPLLTPPNGS